MICRIEIKLKIRFENIIKIGLILSGLFALIWWNIKDPVSAFTLRVPGMDNRGKGVAAEVTINIGEFFESFSELTTNLGETWPRFRGSEYDNICKSPIKLLDKFGTKGPKIIWTAEMGEGHAGAAIYKGAVYVLDHDEKLRADMLRCFSLENGTEIWRRWYKVNIKRNHGMSRTVPAVTDKYILTLGPKAHVMCVDRNSGNLLWGMDIEKQYESEIPLWYTGQCPLIDNEKAIIATGGKALIIAVDCATGKVLWETPNPKGWKMSHSSIIPFIFGGRKMYVYSSFGGVCGIAADGPDEGRVLWETSEWDHQVVAPSPVCMPDGKIFLTAGYGAGAMMLQIRPLNDIFNVEVLKEYLPKDGLACEQQTPIYYLGHLFGIEPKDAGALRNQLVCYDPSDVTKLIWSSGQTARFGLGPYIIADKKLYVLSDDGTFTIVKPDIKKYIQLDQVKLFDGQDSWAPLAVADGYMVMRDSKTMFCLDLNIK
jgi:outer membrane protein assembly factor BamB